MTPQAKWNKAHPEKLREATRKWREQNRDSSRLTARLWKKNNPAKHAAINMKRKAAKLQRTVAWADLKKIEAVYEEAIRLTNETGILHHVDHIIPLQGDLVSGLHVETNLQVLTAEANMIKGNKYE